MSFTPQIICSHVLVSYGKAKRGTDLLKCTCLILCSFLPSPFRLVSASAQRLTGGVAYALALAITLAASMVALDARRDGGDPVSPG